MPRPPKWRRVEFLPQVNYFKPAGIPLREIEEILLPVEELEAIRLKDLEGLEQEACAKRMRVSRPTFHRILTSARFKIAEALITGKAIRVEGGKFRVAYRNLRCKDCGYEWEFSYEETKDAPGAAKENWLANFECPNCSSENFQQIEFAEPGMRNRCRGRRRGGRD